MKGPRTSVAAEQWALSAAHLTVARVFLLEEEIMRVLLGSAPGDLGLHQAVGTRPRFLPLLHKQRAQTAAISCPRVLLGSTHLCGHRGRAAAVCPRGTLSTPRPRRARGTLTEGQPGLSSLRGQVARTVTGCRSQKGLAGLLSQRTSNISILRNAGGLNGICILTGFRRVGGRWYMNLSPGGWSPREEKQEREPPVLRPAPRTRERALSSHSDPRGTPLTSCDLSSGPSSPERRWWRAKRQEIDGQRLQQRLRGQRSGNLSSGEKGRPHPRRPDMSP